MVGVSKTKCSYLLEFLNVKVLQGFTVQLGLPWELLDTSSTNRDGKGFEPQTLLLNNDRDKISTPLTSFLSEVI